MAIQAYREALRVNPQMADAHYNLGNVYMEKGQPSMAATHYKQALMLRPNWDKAQLGTFDTLEPSYPRARDPEPQGFAGPLGHLVENPVDAQLLEHLGDQIELAHGHATAQHQHVVRLEVELEAVLELDGVILDVIIRDALKAVLAQGSDDAVGI